MCSVAKVCVHSCSVAKKNFHEVLGLHYAMFVPTLSNQCTPEQRDKWLPLTRSYQAIGTYAQTELGHGQSFSFMDLWHVCILVHTSLLSEPGLI